MAEAHSLPREAVNRGAQQQQRLTKQSAIGFRVKHTMNKKIKRISIRILLHENLRVRSVIIRATNCVQKFE